MMQRRSEAATEILASPPARDLLARLRNAHGPVTLHVSESYGVSVVCLPSAELRLGSRDVLMGLVEGAPLYMMAGQVDYWRGSPMRLDVSPGRAAGFSLDSAEDMHFTLRKRECVIRRLKEAVGVDLDPA